MDSTAIDGIEAAPTTVAATVEGDGVRSAPQAGAGAEAEVRKDGLLGL